MDLIFLYMNPQGGLVRLHSLFGKNATHKTALGMTNDIQFEPDIRQSRWRNCKDSDVAKAHAHAGRYGQLSSVAIDQPAHDESRR